jgi:hypothetical protein
MIHRRQFLDRSLLLAATASLGLAMPSFAAEGVNLAWNHCLGEGTGVQNVAFACDNNTGSHVMIGSFVLGHDLAAVIGAEVVIDLAAASPSLPAWWMFRNVGSCRQSSMSANFVEDATDVVCQDWAGGAAAGGLASYCTIAGECVDHPTTANVARVKVGSAVAPQNAVDLVAGIEYFDFNLLINNQHTVGTGSCAGCETPVCIVLNSIRVVPEGDIGSRTLTTPIAPGTNFVTWQGGGVPVVGGVAGCPAVTAAHGSTWGAVKSLYR